jgi:hypothetical protein
VKYFLSIISVVVCASGLFGQRPENWIELGDEAWNEADWYSAYVYYKNAFDMDSTEFDATVKYAEGLRMIKNYKLAEYYYDKLYSKDKGKLFPEGQFRLASMQKYNSNYAQSLRNFKKYSKKFKRQKDSYDWLKSQQEIEACTWSINARRNDSKTVIKNLGDPVNTKESEFAAVLGDRGQLYFSSIRGEGVVTPQNSKVRVFVAEKEDSVYKTSDPLNAEVNLPTHHQGNCTFSPDGKTVYFSRCETEADCKIYQAVVKEDGWYYAEELKVINAPDCRNTMPNLTVINGTQFLFFVSDRPGGEGGLDIWWSEFDDDLPGAAVNAGYEVNSMDNEITPFYHDGGLYFSSDWHVGFGGYDIFRSEGKPRQLRKPENLGYPINSSANDLYYTYYNEEKKGFFASNRPGSYSREGETCCNDIYSIEYTDSLRNEELPYDDLEELNDYLPVTLYFHNDEPNPDVWDTTTTLSYMDAYRSYIDLEAKYKRENARGLSGDAKENAEFDVEDFFDFHVDKGVNDLGIFSRLLLESLEQGDKVELSIRGFASPRAQSDYNVNLTKRRINSLQNFLERTDSATFAPYIESKALQFVEIPYGEYEADQNVSDDYQNEKESIYSRGARMERKIMIESVQRAAEDSVFSQLSFDSEIHDFGIISPNFPLEHTFTLTNRGTSVLTIDSLETTCGCTVADISKTILEPGETTEMTVVFDPKDKSGLVTRTIIIHTNEGQEPRRIQISAEVRE